MAAEVRWNRDNSGRIQESERLNNSSEGGAKEEGPLVALAAADMLAAEVLAELTQAAAEQIGAAEAEDSDLVVGLGPLTFPFKHKQIGIGSWSVVKYNYYLLFTIYHILIVCRTLKKRCGHG